MGKMIKSFRLGNRKYKVKVVDSIDDSGLGRNASCLGVIHISKNFHGYKIPFDSKEQTLYHEVLHAIMSEIGRDDLNNDEVFIQSTSLLLHQFERTKK
jgi:hypothetical protein